MDKVEAEKKIRELEDFIKAPKYNNSLNKFLAKTDGLLENKAIGRLLLISKEEVEELYLQSVAQLKEEMNPDGEKDCN